MSTTFDVGAWAGTLAWAAGALAVVLAVTFVVAKVVGRHNVIDTTWGLLFVTVAVVVVIRSAGHGDDVRRWLLLALPAVWGLRLAGHVGRRSAGKGEDPRYDRLLGKAKVDRDLYAFGVVYLLQGVLAVVISAPMLVGGFEAGPVGPLAWIGVAVWVVGVFFESVGDAQLDRYRADPANKGTLIDSGLWRYTRHPNYFGDACVWWGIFLVAADALPGVATIFAPVVMTLLLTVGSGTRIMEAHMRGRPGWAEYAARTSRFVPRPPKKEPGPAAVR